MRSTVIVFFSGIVIGVGITYVAIKNGGVEIAPITVPAARPLACEPQSEPRRVGEMEATSKAAAPVMVDPSSEVAHASSSRESVATSEESEDETAKREEVLRWRVSAIEKFVPLTEEQKRRLADKFQQEQQSRELAQEVHTESLEEILGEESANYYQGQVRAAFARVQDEEVQKEALWTSRQLQLSAEQENAVLRVFSVIEQRVGDEFRNNQHGAATSSRDRIKSLIAENKRRAELRAEELKSVLPPDKYEAYLRAQAESAASDMEVFHDPGN